MADKHLHILLLVAQLVFLMQKKLGFAHVALRRRAEQPRNQHCQHRDNHQQQRDRRQRAEVHRRHDRAHADQRDTRHARQADIFGEMVTFL